MTFIDIRNLQERRQTRDSQFEDTRDIRNGYLFEVNGSVEGDREGLVWFRARDGNSEPFQIFYNGIIGDLRANMPVKIERNPKDPARWRIIEFDTGIYFDDQSAYQQLPSLSSIPKKSDYEWPPGFPGAKALNIFPRAITDFAVRPTSPASMKARVYSGIYPGATNYARFQGPVNTKDFTADVPGAGLARLAAISIDNTGTLNYTNGTTFVDGLPMPDASLPAVPASQMLISAVRLVNGMTAIEESNFDLEMRPLMANGTVNVKVSEVWESDFGAVALQADADGNIGVKTAAPQARVQVGNGVPLFSPGVNNVIMAGPDTSSGRFYIEGTGQADFLLVDGGAAANIKASQLINTGGTTRFRSILDSGSLNVDNILVMDHASGNVGLREASPDSNLVVNADAFIGPAAASGNTSNANMAIGLTINQEADDDEIFALKSSDVAHGMTTLTETDTYCAARKASTTAGGLTINGYTEDFMAIQYFGNVTNDVTTKTTGSRGAIVLSAGKKSGTTIGDMGANANLIVMRNRFTARWILDAEGDIFYGGSDDGAITDEHDDAHLLSGFRAIMSPKDSPAHKRFRGFLNETEDILVQQGVLTAPLKKGGLVSDTGLKGLLIDAIMQLNGKINKLEGN